MADQPSFIPSAWAANNSTTETIPATTSESGKASWDQGFPVETSLPLSEGGIPPKYGDFNGILNILSQFCLFAQSGGQYAWNATLDYSVGSIVLGTDGSIYRAAQVSGPSTTAVNPVGDTSGKWERIVSQSDINALEQEISDAMDAAEDAASNASAAQSAVTTLDANVVKLSGNQTVGGIKTFTSETRQQRAGNLGVVLRCQNTSLTKGTPPDEQQNTIIDLVVDKNYNRLSTIESLVRTNGNIVTRLYAFHNSASLSSDVKIEVESFPDGTGAAHAPGTLADNSTHATNNDVITRGYFNDNVVKRSGNQEVGGVKTFNDAIVTAGGIKRQNTTGIQSIYGGTTSTDGARFELVGGSRSNNPGAFYLTACKDASNYTQLFGKPDGTLTWGGNNVITAAGGTMTGAFVKSDVIASSGTTTGNICIYSGTGAGDGAGIWLYGKSNSTRPGWVLLQTYLTAYRSIYFDGTNFNPAVSNTYNLGTTNNRWAAVWQQNGSITGSDERIKAEIDVIPDTVLDAWGDVNWQQFKMRDSVKEKGENARLHTGMIAQRIDDAFKARGLDVSRYGLFCHDSWEAREAEYDENGEVTIPGVEAGEEYSLRYEEALAMEAAYQRRRADRAEARITALERRLDEMEAVLASLMSPVGDETYAEYAEPEQEQDAEQDGEQENGNEISA